MHAASTVIDEKIVCNKKGSRRLLVYRRIPDRDVVVRPVSSAASGRGLGVEALGVVQGGDGGGGGGGGGGAGVTADELNPFRRKVRLPFLSRCGSLPISPPLPPTTLLFFFAKFQLPPLPQPLSFCLQHISSHLTSPQATQ